MKIAITTETTADLTKELLERFDIKTIPLKVILGDKQYDDGDLTNEEIFAYVEKTGVLPKTNAVNESEFDEFFENLLKEYDAVVHISLSSEISCTYQNAVSSAKKFEKVYVIDSRSLSTGVGMQAIYAREVAKKFDDPEKVVELVEARKDKVQASFIVERLDYLYKGGRCSGFQLLGANLLKLRPRIVVKDGKMSSDKKFRGSMDKAVRKYCQDCLNEFFNIDKSMAFITFPNATPEMIQAAREELESVGVKNIFPTTAGGTITSHCGEHTLGILYYNDGLNTLEN